MYFKAFLRFLSIFLGYACLGRKITATQIRPVIGEVVLMEQIVCNNFLTMQAVINKVASPFA